MDLVVGRGRDGRRGTLEDGTRGVHDGWVSKTWSGSFLKQR
jgi:hypothetical protein